MVWIKERSERKNPSLSESKIATRDTSGISKPSRNKLIPTNTSNSPKRKSRMIRRVPRYQYQNVDNAHESRVHLNNPLNLPPFSW